MLRFAVFAALACGEARGRLSEEAVDLHPESMRDAVASIGGSGPLAIFVDFSQWGLYHDLFEHLRTGGLPQGVQLARLNCAKFFTFCEDTLLVQPWDSLRLYSPGSRVSATGHTAFPIGLLAKGHFEDDEPFGFDYLKKFLESDGLVNSKLVVASWESELLELASRSEGIQVSAGGPLGSLGPVRVTDDNFELVMRRALEQEGGQVFMLYHGSYLDCAEQVDAAMGAQAILEKDRVASSFTIGLVNCDLQHAACEAAGLAGYCHANHFWKQNACPNNIGGPRGNAVYKGKYDAESIASAIGVRLPARLAIEGYQEL